MTIIPDEFMARPPEGIMARKKLGSKRKYKNRKPSWMACGFDVSMSSIAGAAVMYDGLLDKYRGPALVMHRWEMSVHYFDRLRDASRPEIFIHSLMSELHGALVDTDQIFIAVEEPWPLGIIKRAESGWVKQQAQIQGVFMGGLVRWGYTNVFEVGNMTWKKSVATELGIKIHPDFKWAVKQWAIDAFGVEDYPDIIKHNKLGKIPKPPTSRAKPIQPDDRYDALGIMDWMEKSYREGAYAD